MLDGILGRGFSAKCKSLMKQAKSRIEVIRRKKNATLKFLKKDMADLLSNGLDINAYGRAEGLMAELTLSSCYDYVELSIDFVMKHLAVLQKIRHCPEDCRQAVASLMVAAARFSDLPELRELRQIFYERYGSSLEIFATKEFVENLSSKPSTMEKKVRLMQDIASEFSIGWDAKAFQQMMCKPTSAQEQHQPKVHGSFQTSDDKYKSVNGSDNVANREKDDAASRQRFTIDGCRLQNDKESNITRRNELNLQSNLDVSNGRYSSSNEVKENVMKRDNPDILFQGRQETTSLKHDLLKGEVFLRSVRSGSSSHSTKNGHVNIELNLHDGNGDNLSKRDRWEKAPKYTSVTAKREQSWSKSDVKHVVVGSSYNCFQDNPALMKKEEGTDKLRHCHGTALPPPYTKPKARGKDGKYGANIDNPTSTNNEEDTHKLRDCHGSALPPYTKPSARGKDGKYGANIDLSHPCSDGNSMHKDRLRNEMKCAGNLPEKIHQDTYYADREGQGIAPSARKHENGDSHQDEIPNPASSLPKPRSSRRKHSKPQSNHEGVGNLDYADPVKRRSRSKRRDDSRRGLQILFDDDHYKNDEEERMMDKLLLHYSAKPSAEPGKVMNSISLHAHKQHAEAGDGVRKDALDGITELPAARSVSLREQPTQPELIKVFTRAATSQVDKSSPARHVHPKLPDYDDFTARFAALKGT